MRALYLISLMVAYSLGVLAGGIGKVPASEPSKIAEVRSVLITPRPASPKALDCLARCFPGMGEVVCWEAGTPTPDAGNAERP